jgi:glutathione synthase/RimK-type ligase-like ATP-grasp enzyme
MSRFLGIAREHVFSPGRESDDDAIFDAVADHLRRAGHEVLTCRGDDPEWPEAMQEDVVFAMCQGDVALERLQRWQTAGIHVVNSPQAILNCMRHRAVPALAAAGIDVPESRIAESAGPLPALAANGNVWIKRGDVHAMDDEDVVFADDAAAARNALQRFDERGISRVIVQRHVAGPVVKFYAVVGRFFRPAAPADFTPLPADVRKRIAELGERAANVLNVEVYGGDCVCVPHAAPVLIDLNDWPSYASCRTEASKAIAAHLQTLLRTKPDNRA